MCSHFDVISSSLCNHSVPSQNLMTENHSHSDARVKQFHITKAFLGNKSQEACILSAIACYCLIQLTLRSKFGFSAFLAVHLSPHSGTTKNFGKDSEENSKRKSFSINPPLVMINTFNRIK